MKIPCTQTNPQMAAARLTKWLVSEFVREFVSEFVIEFVSKSLSKSLSVSQTFMSQR